MKNRFVRSYSMQEKKALLWYRKCVKVKVTTATMPVLMNIRTCRKSGVIDPAKVARVALENAASIAGMFLTTECVLVEEKDEKAPQMPPMGGGGMGGMM